MNLEEQIHQKVESSTYDGEFKISVHDIKTGLSANYAGNDPGWAASIIKVPVMTAVHEQVKLGNLAHNTILYTNHDYMLEHGDTVSRMRDNFPIAVLPLLKYMITESDNEATNILIDEIGINTLNQHMWKYGMKDSMLGHLLCPGVPRYSSDFNPDGSNITTTDDMVTILRHIYDDSFSQFSPEEREMSRKVMNDTNGGMLSSGKMAGRTIKAKLGYISDVKAGSDSHDVGIIDNRLVVAVMRNKLGAKTSGTNFSLSWNDFNETLGGYSRGESIVTSVLNIVNDYCVENGILEKKRYPRYKSLPRPQRTTQYFNTFEEETMLGGIPVSEMTNDDWAHLYPKLFGEHQEN